MGTCEELYGSTPVRAALKLCSDRISQSMRLYLGVDLGRLYRNRRSGLGQPFSPTLLSLKKSNLLILFS